VTFLKLRLVVPFTVIVMAALPVADAFARHW
jgi:hypothetical protein